MKPDLNTIVLAVGFILVWLSNKKDLRETQNFLSARIDRLGDKLDDIHKTLGKHDAEIDNLKAGRHNPVP